MSFAGLLGGLNGRKKMQNAWHRTMLKRQCFLAPSLHMGHLFTWLRWIIRHLSRCKVYEGEEGALGIPVHVPLMGPVGATTPLQVRGPRRRPSPTAFLGPYHPAEPQAGLTGRAQGHIGRGHVRGRLEGLDLSRRLAGWTGAHNVHLTHAEAGGGRGTQGGEGTAPGLKSPCPRPP